MLVSLFDASVLEFAVSSLLRPMKPKPKTVVWEPQPAFNVGTTVWGSSGLGGFACRPYLATKGLDPRKPVCRIISKFEENIFPICPTVLFNLSHVYSTRTGLWITPPYSSIRTTTKKEMMLVIIHGTPNEPKPGCLDPESY